MGGLGGSGGLSILGGSPGGTSGAIQYNNGGSFGGSLATITAGGVINASSGAVGAPSYSFLSFATSGLYAAAGPIVSMAIGGAEITRWASTGLDLGPLALGFGAALGSVDVNLIRDAAADTLAQRRGTNAQINRLYNTYTLAGVQEWFESSWTLQANSCSIRTVNSGGTARILRFCYSNTNSEVIQIPTGTGGTLLFCNGAVQATAGQVRMEIAKSVTATSGTHTEFHFGGGPQPTSTSTMAFKSIVLDAAINYSNGTPGAGKVQLLYLNPTNTALPTGRSSAIAVSSTGSALGGIHLYNTSDEDTNAEWASAAWAANVFNIFTNKAGSGTDGNLALGTNGTARLTLATASATLTIPLLFSADNTLDIGAAGATRPRTAYLGTSLQMGAIPAAAGAIRMSNLTNISFRNAANSADVVALQVTGTDIIQLGSGNASSVTLSLANVGFRIDGQTTGAAAQVGTLTNAPSAGNPSFWLPISIAGATRYIPCWT